MDNNTPGEQLSPEPQSERGEPGSRDTGSDQPGGGPADRPEGALPQESVPSHGGSEEGKFGGTGTKPPQDTGSAIPPYEGRQTSAKPTGGEGSAEPSGAKTAGATRPVADPTPKAPAPEGTPGGATASPADEQPAGDQPETDRDDDRVGPDHVSGTGRGEKKL